MAAFTPRTPDIAPGTPKAPAPVYSYNTGKLLAPGQAQDTINAQGQRIGGGTPVAPPRSGTTGNAAGSQAPVAPQAAALSGTYGNPAGSKLPTGTVATNTKAANSSITVAPTKKPDWQTTLANVQASNAKNAPNPASSNIGSGQYGDYMSHDTGYKPPVAPTQTASAWDSIKNFFSPPEPQFKATIGENLSPEATASAYKSISNNYGTPAPTQTASAPISSPYNFSANTSSVSNPSNNAYSTPDPSYDPSRVGKQEVATAADTAPTGDQTTSPVKTTGTFGLDNTRKTTTTQTQVQTAASASDEAKNQAEAARQAAESATNDEDKKYYTQLYNDAKEAADKSEADYQALIGKSQEELDAQAQLDAETNALQLGKTDVAGQPIPLSFITGQQSALERRSLDRTAPLSSKLARLQSARQASMALAQERNNVNKDQFKTAQSNLTSLTAEQRKRQQELSDRSHTEGITASEKAQAQANIEQKFEEDKRQFGLDYANKQREIAIQQQNANTSATSVKNVGNGYMNSVQLKQQINQQFASPSFQNAPDEEKRNYIYSLGGNPADYNL